ncbi:putative MFS transporter [Cantharellus anzutake]|uniref:putative MFS transporter n=1 Tax=Cantharellus anzutake TaxID=1750568 RepID=UPI001907703E|nr:putative MFS transporter [Cantharellus anzutake]KAF8339857.1 putative MFS transporter [Cantharellus anzutake]
MTPLQVLGSDAAYEVADWLHGGDFEKEIVRKLDMHIIPMVTILHLLAFLDRVNIGNARLYGLEKDLHLNGNKFQVSVSVVFVTYLLFEIPSNLVLKKFTPSRYIAALAVIWSIVASMTGLVHTYGQLIACRVLLGMFEAGLFPGLLVYLMMFYTKQQLALRIGSLSVSAALAGACGGLLAYGIGFMDGINGMRGWRWIMIMEGLPTFFAGVLAFFVLADHPSRAWYLTAEEKEFLRLRRLREQGESENAQKFHWSDVRKGLTSWRVLMFALGQFGCDTMLYGYSIFLPTIIKEIGSWSTPTVQAGAVTYLVAAHFSDKTHRRGVFAVAFGSISVIGYIILLASTSVSARYIACFLVATGLYVVVGIPLSWLSTNSPRYGKRAAGSGLQLTVGNSSGVVVPFIYTHGPRFVKGHTISLAMVSMSTALYAILWYSYTRANATRARGEEDWKLDGKTDEEVEEMGDESPRFVYWT